MAFLAAATDAAMGRNSELGAPLNVRCVCAIDLRNTLHLPANYMNNSASIVPIHTTFPHTVISDDGHSVVGGDLWSLALSAQELLLQNIEAGEAYRLQDITKRGAFAEFGPYFDILSLWSNMGRLDSVAVDSAHVHLRGAATNPIISGHPITAASGELCLTLTFSPAFHNLETVSYMGKRFHHHIIALASST